MQELKQQSVRQMLDQFNHIASLSSSKSKYDKCQKMIEQFHIINVTSSWFLGVYLKHMKETKLWIYKGYSSWKDYIKYTQKNDYIYCSQLIKITRLFDYTDAENVGVGNLMMIRKRFPEKDDQLKRSELVAYANNNNISQRELSKYIDKIKPPQQKTQPKLLTNNDETTYDNEFATVILKHPNGNLKTENKKEPKNKLKHFFSKIFITFSNNKKKNIVLIDFSLIQNTKSQEILISKIKGLVYNHLSEKQ